MEKAVVKKFEDDHRDRDFEYGGKSFPVLPAKTLKEWRSVMEQRALAGGYGAGSAFDAINKDSFKCDCRKSSPRCDDCLRKARNIGNIA